MTITLHPIPVADLRELAESRIPASVASIAVEGALPPAFVAKRSLDHLANGKPRQWCRTYYMVRSADHLLVGGCGFKGAPTNGRVEIGYRVASSCRNQGIAAAAVRALLDIAYATGDVREVLAQVSPDNLSSTRVVMKLGFTRGAMLPDKEGEMLVQWVSEHKT